MDRTQGAYNEIEICRQIEQEEMAYKGMGEDYQHYEEMSGHTNHDMSMRLGGSGEEGGYYSWDNDGTSVDISAEFEKFQEFEEFKNKYGSINEFEQRMDRFKEMMMERYGAGDQYSERGRYWGKGGRGRGVQMQSYDGSFGDYYSGYGRGTYRDYSRGYRGRGRGGYKANRGGYNVSYQKKIDQSAANQSFDQSQNSEFEQSTENQRYEKFAPSSI